MKLTADADAPGFDAAWQAQVYGIAQLLVENGVISAGEWSEALGAAIRRREADGSDRHEDYFEAVSDALISVLALSPDEVNETMAAWRSAYETTPHGKPVKLDR